MATTIQLVSGNKSINLSKTTKPITVQKVQRYITLTHIGASGPQGDKGDTGDAGPANSLSIGTVTTGEAGSDAAATISGSAPSQTLDLTIPQGTQGETGDAATITIGTTATLDAGSDATVENIGTSSAAELNFGIPQGTQGDKGDTGETGATGATGADGATWYTGSGTPSTMYNDGDLYLDTSTGDIYKQTAGSWGSSIENITGPQGDTGESSYSAMSVSEGETGTATTSRVVRADYLKLIIDYYVQDALGAMNADNIYGWQ